MLWGFVSSLVLLFAFYAHNWRRSQLKVVEELKPNCLLTHSPLVFITGKRSLFYFLAYWNQIPHFLASHGYDVYNVHLPWMNETRRRRDLHLFLVQQSNRRKQIHLFLDQSSLRDITALLRKQDYDCLSSVTMIGDSGRLPPFRLNVPIAELPLAPETENRPFFWKLHALWTFQGFRSSVHHLGWQMDVSRSHFLLDRIQFLAERDLLHRSGSPNLR